MNDWGEEICRCIEFDDFRNPSTAPSTAPTTGARVRTHDNNDANNSHNSIVSPSSFFEREWYGFGCDHHDLESRECSKCINNDDDIEDSKEIKIIKGEHECSDWCKRKWCWVDDRNCQLLSRRSNLFRRRWYSYATCGHIDSYEQEALVRYLSGKTIKVAFLHNAGGWKGAYNKNRQHFQGPLQDWSGSIVDLTKEAANAANFTIQMITGFSPTLINHSSRFWGGSPNIVDHCIYAASLGIVDLCVTTIMMTSLRITLTPFSKNFYAEHYLIGMDDAYPTSRGSEGLILTLATIFSPLQASTWIFVILFVIPVMGLLFIVHEYGSPQFPKVRTMVPPADSKPNHHHESIDVHVPMRRYFWRSVYNSGLSVLEQQYDKLTIRTLGGKLHLIGMSTFILYFISVYTASLTAILTDRARMTKVENLNDVIHRGYRICTIRSVYKSVKERYKLHDGMFTVDPPEQGGDGLPGFACANCARGRRVLDFLDPTLADTDERYCHVAVFGPSEIQTRQSKGEHCNKTLLSKAPLISIASGFPMYSGVSKELSTLFSLMHNSGVWTKALEKYRPKSTCSTPLIDPTDLALTRMELAGIWIITIGLSVTGLLVTLFLQEKKMRATKKLARSSDPKHSASMKAVITFDQKGRSINRVERDDSLQMVQDLMKKNSIADSTRSLMTRSRDDSSFNNNGRGSGLVDIEEGTSTRSMRVLSSYFGRLSSSGRSIRSQRNSSVLRKRIRMIDGRGTSASSVTLDETFKSTSSSHLLSSKRSLEKMDSISEIRKRRKSFNGIEKDI